MSQELTLPAGGLPAELLAAFGDPSANSDLSAGVSAGFPIISYKGKDWAVTQGGDRQLITDDEGEPRRSIEVIIIKANAKVSKVYYPNGYTEGSDEKPTCFSHDGIAPDPEAEKPQANKCAICPHNAWGSRITENGARGKNCSDSRRLAVSPSMDIENPMLLRVPAASLKDLMVYGDTLARRKIPYQAVITKIGFDPTVAYPKMTFKPVSFLTEAQVNQVMAVMNGPVVESIMGLRDSAPALAAPVEDDEIAGAPPANMQQVADTTAKPKAAAVTADDVAAALETPAEPEAPATPAPAAAKKVSGFGGGKAEPQAANGPTATAAPATAASAAPAEPKTDKASKLIDSANASLEDVLAVLDD